MEGALGALRKGHPGNVYGVREGFLEAMPSSAETWRKVSQYGKKSTLGLGICDRFLG